MTAIDQAGHVKPEPILTSIAAQLFVADISASYEFFTTKLGFVVDFVYGDPPFYAQVSRDNARLALRLVGEPVYDGDVREQQHLIAAAITVATVDEIDRLFLSYRSQAVPFHQPLADEPWGARTFIVRDPDGNLILFAGPSG